MSRRIELTDVELAEIRARLLVTAEAAEIAEAAATAARRRRRDAVRYAHKHGLSYADIAHIVGVSKQRAHQWGD